MVYEIYKTRGKVYEDVTQSMGRVVEYFIEFSLLGCPSCPWGRESKDRSVFV